MRKMLFCAVGAVLLSTAAHAQQVPSSATVVTVCGTPLSTYSVGTTRPLTQDPNGKVCINATVSASVAVAPLTSTNLSDTIAVTDTFQSIQVSTAGRNGCTIQNTSGNGDAMWVFFGAVASATKSTSFKLADGQGISCAVGGLGVLTDQVSITGTATDTFAANFQ